MRFAGFQSPSDRARPRRFVLTFGLSGLLYLGIGTGVVLLARGATTRSEERELDVTFRPPPAVAAAPPSRALPPPPAPRPRRAARPIASSGGKARGLVAPSAISDRVDEASPGAPLAPVPEEPADGAAPAPVPRAAPPRALPRPPPPPAPPLPEADEPVTPPVPEVGNAVPEYPAAARSKGLEGVVILKILIGEDGRVAAIDVLRGAEPFLAAALAAVRTWRYAPARRAGASLRYTRIVKIPFRIRTV